MLSAFLAARAPEFDIGRVVFIIMLLLGGFFQWVMNWWKKKQAEAEMMRRLPPSPEELQAREKTWRDQVGAVEQTPSPPVVQNPLEELLKTFRQFAAPEIAVVPPPLPPSPVVPVVEAPKLIPAPVKTSAAPQAKVQKRPRHPLAMKLSLIGGLRQAVVLREIIGPPKALQSTDDHLI